MRDGGSYMTVIYWYTPMVGDHSHNLPRYNAAMLLDADFHDKSDHVNLPSELHQARPALH